MKEEIEEYLEENFEFLHFKVNYEKVRTYNFIIDLLIKDNEQLKTIRIKFDYIWNSQLSKERNLYHIKQNILKSILNMFIKEDEDE